MSDATLVLVSGSARKLVSLSDYLTAADAEHAHENAYVWIKSLRGIEMDGGSFRQRFTARGDSLWWFTEIYLHKQRIVLDIFRTIAAMQSLVAQERPARIEVRAAAPPMKHVIGRTAAAMNVATDAHVSWSEWSRRLFALDLHARGLTLSAYVTPDRFRRAASVARSPQVAAFIHRAFWRSGGDEGSAESYIGPVLAALEQRAGAGAVRYVGIGPQTNFRQRRRVGITQAGSRAVVAVERYAPLSTLRESRRIWGRRYEHFRVLSGNHALKSASRIQGIDCWPLIKEQLAGIAWLQWPWSVRAMDEAAAALDRLEPSSVLTYAEAGGWGRALVLEARRRRIPSVGLQHGFIYRHWLNYLHEVDEMQEDGSTDGFPAPTRTLVFDAYAAEHLRRFGRFAPESLRVTGSPKLDALVQGVREVTPGAIASARRVVGAGATDTLVLVTTKEREAREALPALVAAAGEVRNVLLVIKPHPAETEGVYDAVARGRERVRVVSPSTPLPPLLAASRALVTVNSTLALDAAVAGVPALVLGLPNNLSPFVEAGVLAGAEPPQISRTLERILYDEGFRAQLESARQVFLERYAMQADGRAAARAADAVLQIAATQG